MSTTNGNMKKFKVTDQHGNVYIMIPVDTEARQAIDEAKDLEFDEDFFTAEETEDSVHVGLNGVPFGVEENTPMQILQDTKEGIVFGADTLFTSSLIGSSFPEFSSSATYTVGQRVLHDSKIYECSTAVQTAGDWNASNWTEISIIEIINILCNGKADLSDLVGEFSTSTRYELNDIVYRDGNLYRYTSVSPSQGSWDPLKWDQVTVYELIQEKLSLLSVTNKYSTTTTYSYGNIVFYSGKLYKYISSTSSSGTWDSTKWEEVTLSELCAYHDCIANTYDPTAAGYSVSDVVFYGDKLYQCNTAISEPTQGAGVGAWNPSKWTEKSLYSIILDRIASEVANGYSYVAVYGTSTFSQVADMRFEMHESGDRHLLFAIDKNVPGSVSSNGCKIAILYSSNASEHVFFCIKDIPVSATSKRLGIEKWVLSSNDTWSKVNAYLQVEDLNTTQTDLIVTLLNGNNNTQLLKIEDKDNSGNARDKNFILIPVSVETETTNPALLRVIGLDSINSDTVSKILTYMGARTISENETASIQSPQLKIDLLGDEESKTSKLSFVFKTRNTSTPGGSIATITEILCDPTNIANLFDSSNAYSFPDIVIYGGQLWKATKKMVSNVPFSTTRWARITLADLVRTRDVSNASDIYTQAIETIDRGFIPVLERADGSVWVINKLDRNSKTVTFAGPGVDPDEGTCSPPNSTIQTMVYGLDQNDDPTSEPKNAPINGGLYNKGSLTRVVESGTGRIIYDIPNNSYGSISSNTDAEFHIRVRTESHFNQVPNCTIKVSTNIDCDIYLEYIDEDKNQLAVIDIVGDSKFMAGHSYILRMIGDDYAIAEEVTNNVGDYPIQSINILATITGTNAIANIELNKDNFLNYGSSTTGLAIVVPQAPNGIVQKATFRFIGNGVLVGLTIMDNMYIYPINGPTTFQNNYTYIGEIYQGTVTLKEFGPAQPVPTT